MQIQYNAGNVEGKSYLHTCICLTNYNNDDYSNTTIIKTTKGVQFKIWKRAITAIHPFNKFHGSLDDFATTPLVPMTNTANIQMCEKANYDQAWATCVRVYRRVFVYGLFMGELLSALIRYIADEVTILFSLWAENYPDAG